MKGIARAIRALRWPWHQEPLSVKRMRDALELHELGVAFYRQRMRREHPEATEAEVSAMVREWLQAPLPGGRLRRPSGRAAP